MSPVLNYSPPSPPDRLAIALGVFAWAFIFLDGAVEIFVGGWHNGLHSIPTYADPQAKDVIATFIICAVPLLGLYTGAWLIWRSRRNNLPGVICGVLAMFFHVYLGYFLARGELWFWLDR